MKLNVGNLRVLITASAQGIGWAIAQLFLEHGAQVCICDINPERLAERKQLFPSIGISTADVSDPVQVERTFQEVVAHMGGVDVLVNNAGISGPTGPIEEVEPEALQQTLKVNIGSHFYFTRLVVPLMKAQGSGSIVNISSTAGLYGYPLRSPYAASKWAVIGLTKTLAMELGSFGIRVNAICPGSINNFRMDGVIEREAQARGMPTEEIRRNYTNQVSMQTFIEPEEIANMVLFICSPAGYKISGQALCVDGHTETMRT
ncbi:MAG: SDR family oxidoreductase [Chloroflexota bacterium]